MKKHWMSRGMFGLLVGGGLALAACGGGSEEAAVEQEQATAPVTQNSAVAESEEPEETEEPVVVPDEWEEVKADAQAWKQEMIPVWVEDCNSGDLFACDFLWFVGASDSAEFEVGRTCGGRNEPIDGGACVPRDDRPITEGDHPLMDQFTQECRDGDLLSCRKLLALSSGTAAYYEYAVDCVSELRAESGPCSIEMKESIF